jgi:NAD-dependent dihydropyrimidine dehydrogenase PreA subunit
LAINKIDYDKCVGCGTCVNTCWHDVLRMDGELKKPVIVYPDDCVLCFRCSKYCPVKAIELVPGMHIPVTSFFSY